MLESNVALPSKPRVVKEEEFQGIFEIDGLFPGYGQTLGNSLRRIILSSLPGAAITHVKIDGVKHEFEAMDGVREDVITILLNLKRVRLAVHGEGPYTVHLKSNKVGTVTAADIDAPSQVEILNPDQPIAEVTAKGTALDIEMTIQRGMGYVAREVHQKEKVDIGAIALDAVFTPIRRANYEVENMRVGDRTDYNRLRIFIETDGTLTPKEALERSIEIMIHQLKAIIGFQEATIDVPSEHDAIDVSDENQVVDPDLLKTRIETLDLSTRTQSALESANIRTVGGLVRKKKDDILSLDGMGPKSVEEVEMILKNMGLSLSE